MESTIRYDISAQAAPFLSLNISTKSEDTRDKIAQLFLSGLGGPFASRTWALVTVYESTPERGRYQVNIMPIAEKEMRKEGKEMQRVAETFNFVDGEGPQLWATEIWASDGQDGKTLHYSGPKVPGATMSEAQEYCNTNGLGYCKVIARVG